LQAFNEFMQQWGSGLAILVSIVIAFPVFMTWWDVWIGKRRRQLEWHRRASREAGGQPGLLVLDLKPQHDTSGVVERFCQRNTEMPELAEVPQARQAVITRNEMLRPEDMPALQNEIRDRLADLHRAGADVIHYFHAGPTAAAAMVGAELANTGRIVVYQYGQDGYENFGPLRLGV